MNEKQEADNFFFLRFLPLNFEWKGPLPENVYPVTELTTLAHEIEMAFPVGTYKVTLNPQQFTECDLNQPLVFLGIRGNSDVYIIKVFEEITIEIKKNDNLEETIKVHQEKINLLEVIIFFLQVILKTLKSGEDISDFYIEIFDNNVFIPKEIDYSAFRLSEKHKYQIVLSTKLKLAPLELMRNSKYLKNQFFIQVLNQSSVVFFHSICNIKGRMKDSNGKVIEEGKQIQYSEMHIIHGLTIYEVSNGFYIVWPDGKYNSFQFNLF